MSFFNPWTPRPPPPANFPGAHDKDGAQEAWAKVTIALTTIYEEYKESNDKCVTSRVVASSLALISFLTAVTTSAASTVFAGAENSQTATQIAAFLTAVSVSAQGAFRVSRTPSHEKSAREFYSIIEDAQREWVANLKNRPPVDLANQIILRLMTKMSEIRKAESPTANERKEGQG